MNQFEVFNFENNQVRTVVVNEYLYFIGKDVAEILGYERPAKAILDHVDEDDKDEVPIQDSIGRMQNTPVINESGLYSLILSSKMPSAKKFKRWVTSEVLPKLRKHGLYATDDLLANPDIAIAAFTALKEERAKRIELELVNQEQKPKVLFADSVETSSHSILIGELAKILKQNSVEIGQNRLFEDLRQDGYLIRRKGNDYNLPTQKSMDLGVMEIKERTVNNPDGSIRLTKTTKVTGKGQIYFVNRYLNRSNGNGK